MTAFVELPEKPENLVVVAPTGSGKTTAVLRRIPQWNRKVIFVLPTRALAYEVASKIKNACVDVSSTRKVGINANVWKKRDVVVTTYERAAHVLANDPIVFENAVLVLDEFHAAKALPAQFLLTAPCHKVLISATMPDVEGLAKYLKAKVVKVEREDCRSYRIFYAGSRENYGIKVKVAVKLVYESGARNGVLIFVCNKKVCESVAKALGVAYVHSGVRDEERKAILERFERGELPAIVATQALAYGVNVKAKRVVIAHLSNMTKGKWVVVPPSDVAQMAGRVGRPGQDGGEVDVIVFDGEETTVRMAMEGKFTKNVSLKREDLADAVLWLANVGALKKVRDVEEVAKKWYDAPEVEYWYDALEELERLGLLRVIGEDVHVLTTGRTLVKLGMKVEAYRTVLENVARKLPAEEVIKVSAKEVSRKTGEKLENVVKKLTDVLEVYSGEDLTHVRIALRRWLDGQ